MKKNKGITLIALIVTIIILIILAGITIGLIAGSEGIMGKTSHAVDKNEESVATEKMELKITYFNMISYGENTRKALLQELAEGLFQDKEIDYVKIKGNKIASLDKIDVTGENSIFVKLKEYPYEFEIDNDLHLASLDGVKIADADSSYSEEINRIVEQKWNEKMQEMEVEIDKMVADKVGSASQVAQLDYGKAIDVSSFLSESNQYTVETDGMLYAMFYSNTSGTHWCRVHISEFPYTPILGDAQWGIMENFSVQLNKGQSIYFENYMGSKPSLVAYFVPFQ